MKLKVTRPLVSGVVLAALLLPLVQQGSSAALGHPSATLAFTSHADPTQQQTSQQGSSDGQSGSTTKRREAPPFDRPPLNGKQSQDSTSSGSSGPSKGRMTGSQQTQTGTSSTSRDDRATGNNTDPSQDPDDETADRSGKQKPVLRRSTDPDSTQSPDASSTRRPTTGPVDQDPTAQRKTSGDDEPLRLESTLVNIPLVVSDRSGRYIPQLTKRDFLLWEDGVQQEVASFASEEVPFKVALLLDVSPSVQGSIRDIQEAAIEFVRQLRSDDEVMVVSFDRNAHFLSDFTSDRRRLEMAIGSTTTGSGTSVYDTVVEVVERRLRGVDGRKAMIMFSDGEDTTSKRFSYSDAINTVTESDVLVYGLRYPGSGGYAGTRQWPPRTGRYPTQIPLPIPLPFPWPVPRKRGPFTFYDMPGGAIPPSQGTYGQSWPRRGGGGDFMADIAAAGGGPVYDARSVGDMRGLASRMAEELRHVYVISYYPTNALSNGGYRTIRVNVKNRDDIAVRHRKGYSAISRDTAKH